MPLIQCKVLSQKIGSFFSPRRDYVLVAFSRSKISRRFDILAERDIGRSAFGIGNARNSRKNMRLMRRKSARAK